MISVINFSYPEFILLLNEARRRTAERRFYDLFILALQKSSFSFLCEFIW